MKYILTILLFLSTYLSNSQVVYELCKGDSIITLYTDYKPNYLVQWFINPNVQILSQDNNEIVIFTNTEGIYKISAYYNNNYCKSDLGYYKIKIVNCLDSYIWFPNAFTPDNDGLNDLFEIKFMYITEYYLEIYNRWGELLFADKTYIWDGYYKDNIVQQDVYVYKFTYRDHNNKYKQQIGKLTLIK
jgi:gliding motility-associated-like protein